jgi:hypothetical protein
MKKPTLNKRSGRKSKHKGASFEREICRELSLWISRGKSKHLFWRSSMSGGRATIAKRKKENLSVQAGDLASIDPAAQRFADTFFVECKNYRTLRLDSLFYKVKGVLTPMWIHAQLQAEQHGKIPLLIVRENGRQILLITGGGPESLRSHIIAKFYAPRMYVHLLSSALEIDPEEFIEAGESADEDSCDSGLTSDGSSKRRIPLGLSKQVVVGSELSESGHPRRPHRRERLS